IPGGGTKWQLYWDADGTDSVTDYPMEVKVTNYYFDQDGSARLVGWITNNSAQTLDDSQVVGGLYAADGTVLDASYAFVPVPVKPGAASPFNISSFSNVDYNPDQAALVDTYTVQPDTGFTSTPYDEFIDLSAPGESVQKEGATWTFNGTVTNTSGKSLSSITVLAMVMDAQNNLLAMEYTTIYPTGDAIAAGETNTYSVPVYLDPAADATGFTTTTLVVGDVK
ncbi:MAG: FxLYD domain-containing protein, partial [Chloroflexi bacterium]|nr:FxLYD domain-containing protein [Chloroflexota bacterium]